MKANKIIKTIYQIELKETDILNLKRELGKIDRSETLNELYILLCKKYKL